MSKNFKLPDLDRLLAVERLSCQLVRDLEFGRDAPRGEHFKSIDVVGITFLVVQQMVIRFFEVSSDCRGLYGLHFAFSPRKRCLRRTALRLQARTCLELLMGLSVDLSDGISGMFHDEVYEGGAGFRTHCFNTSISIFSARNSRL